MIELFKNLFVNPKNIDIMQIETINLILVKESKDRLAIRYDVTLIMKSTAKMYYKTKEDNFPEKFKLACENVNHIQKYGYAPKGDF